MPRVPWSSFRWSSKSTDWRSPAILSMSSSWFLSSRWTEREQVSKCYTRPPVSLPLLLCSLSRLVQHRQCSSHLQTKFSSLSPRCHSTAHLSILRQLPSTRQFWTTRSTIVGSSSTSPSSPSWSGWLSWTSWLADHLITLLGPVQLHLADLVGLVEPTEQAD